VKLQEVVFVKSKPVDGWLFAACSQTVMLHGSVYETVAFDISDTEHPSYQYSNLEPPRDIGNQHHGKR
jgi:hypothetical protein